MDIKVDSISLDKPFIEQQICKDFLGLTTDEPVTKVSFRKLLNLSKKIIQNYLVDCGFSERELAKIEIGYQFRDNENEDYYLGWFDAQKSLDNNQENQPVKSASLATQPSLRANNSNKSLPLQPQINAENFAAISTNFFSTLNQRINEIAKLEMAWLVNNNLEFRNLPQIRFGVCHEGFRAIYVDNKFNDWQRDELGNKIPC